jgi:hypothetical protein
VIAPASLAAPPSHIHVPARDGSLLKAVTAVAGKVGRSMDDAQQLAVDVLTSSWSDSRPASLEAGVIAARQNLKTYVLENIALTVMTRPGNVRLGVWSAHEVATAQETFRTFLDLAESYEWLSSRITKVSRATGREGIEFVGGRRLRFRARIKTGGRGLAGDIIFLDEAFALEPGHMGSLLPILSTRPFGRVIYGSSAPLAESDILRRLIKRGRAGAAGAPAYIEWSAPGSLSAPGCPDGRKCTHEVGTPGCALDDESLWRAANPAIGANRPHGISLEYVRGERMALPPAEFARERLGWGEDPDEVSRVLPASAWENCRDPASRRVGDAVLALDVSPDRAYAAVSMAALNGDGLPMGQVVRHGPGVVWAVPEIGGLVRAKGIRLVVVDSVGPAKNLLPDLTEEVGDDVEVLVMKAGDVTDAFADLYDGVITEQVRHLGQPELDAAIEAATTRLIDSRKAWDRRHEGDDITCVVSFGHALWGLAQAGTAFFASSR